MRGFPLHDRFYRVRRKQPYTLKSIKRFKKVQSIKVANKQNAEQQSNCLSSGPSNSLEIAPIDCAQQTTLSITPNEAMSTVTAESKKQCKEGTPSNESTFK